MNVLKGNIQSYSHYINNCWESGTGELFHSINPFNGEKLWSGKIALSVDVDAAVKAAKYAFNYWSETPITERQSHLKLFAQTLQEHKSELQELISMEVGKPLWEAKLEVEAMISKITISIEAYNTRCKEFPGGNTITRFKPHGVVAVFGPYNFPGHLPNGHIIPALLAGNTLVFKPSDRTPAVAQKTMELWIESGLPTGVLNLIQGNAETGKLLVNHPDISGVFFTGSEQSGLAISKTLVSNPNKILALEMGGNNPLIVHEVGDPLAAVFPTIESAYLTSGQRCTCARRLIVPEGQEGDNFIKLLIEHIQKIQVGDPAADPQPFMGPVISAQVAESLIQEQSQLVKHGGKILCELKSLSPGTGLVSPGLIDVTQVSNREDKEIFGPLLQLIRVKDFSSALQEAANTRFGLSAGILTDNQTNYEAFAKTIKAGIINWNTSTVGASSSAPFGGVGNSGNHRPSAYFAADYCAYPVVSIEKPTLEMPATLPKGLS